MPDNSSMTTDSCEPAPIGGGSSFDPVKIEETATEAVLDPDGVGIRAPSHDEGAVIWEMVREAGILDLNSPYAYLMQCRNFRSTCAIAEVYGRPAGFVLAHRLPDSPDVLFVWQIGVLPDYRGQGIAKRLLDDLLERAANVGVRTIETTVTLSNRQSAALFAAFAKSRGAKLVKRPGFGAESFPEDTGHEAEDLFVISPVASIA